jgi:hypothetical protein
MHTGLVCTRAILLTRQDTGSLPTCRPTYARRPHTGRWVPHRATMAPAWLRRAEGYGYAWFGEHGRKGVP